MNVFKLLKSLNIKACAVIGISIFSLLVACGCINSSSRSVTDETSPRQASAASVRTQLIRNGVVDTDGNPVTDETEIGDIDCTATKVIDIKNLIAPGYNVVSNLAAHSVQVVPLMDPYMTMESISNRLVVAMLDGEHLCFDMSAIENGDGMTQVYIGLDGSSGIVRLEDAITGKMYIGRYIADETISSILEKTIVAYVPITVVAETLDDVIVTNQVVTLHEGTNTNGRIWDSLPYEGLPVSFTVPKGFQYYIEITDNWPSGSHHGPHVIDGSQTGYANITTSATFAYYDPMNMDMSGVTNFVALAEIVSGVFAQNEIAARRNLVGLEFDDTWTSADGTTYDDPLVCVDVGWFTNELDEVHLGAILQRKWATLRSVQFDERNQEVSTDVTAQVGTYYYGWQCDAYDNTATYATSVFCTYNGQLWRCKTAITSAMEWSGTTNWEVVGNLVGSTAPPVFDSTSTYAVNDIVYYHNTTTGDTRLYRCRVAVTEPGEWTGYTNWTYLALDIAETKLFKISTTVGEPIDSTGYFLVFKTSLASPESSVKNTIRYGHNNWRDSAYRQYLNSDATKGGWWHQQHIGQIAPNNLETIWGYKRGCSANLLSAVRKVKISTWPNYNTDGPNNASTVYTTLDEFWLPSGTEMIGSVNSYEGRGFEYWKDILFGALEDGGVTVERYDTYNDFPATGSSGTVYQNYVNGNFYTWSGTAYTNITNDDGSNATTGGKIRTARRQFSITNHGSPVVVRLRSAYRYNSYVVWFVISSGYISGNIANVAYAAVPACVIY